MFGVEQTLPSLLVLFVFLSIGVFMSCVLWAVNETTDLCFVLDIHTLDLPNQLNANMPGRFPPRKVRRTGTGNGATGR